VSRFLRTTAYVQGVPKMT